MDGTPGRRGVETCLGWGDDEAMDGTPGRRGVETVLGWGDDDGQLGEREHHGRREARRAQRVGAVGLASRRRRHGRGLFFRHRRRRSENRLVGVLGHV